MVFAPLNPVLAGCPLTVIFVCGPRRQIHIGDITEVFVLNLLAVEKALIIRFFSIFAILRIATNRRFFFQPLHLYSNSVFSKPGVRGTLCHFCCSSIDTSPFSFTLIVYCPCWLSMKSRSAP